MSVRKHAMVLGAFAFTFMSTNAHAGVPQPEYCTPDQQTCSCPADLPDNVYCKDASYSDVAELITSEDPALLREALGVTTTYNEEFGVYEVSLDAEALNGVGVVFMHPNAGTWEKDELLEYVYTFMGVEADTEHVGVLPPILVRQTGYADRIALTDTGEVEFLSYSTGNLLFDILRGPLGKLEVFEASGVFTPAFDSVVGKYINVLRKCHDQVILDKGTTQEFYAEHCGFKSSGDQIYEPPPSQCSPDSACEPESIKRKWGGNVSFNYSWNDEGYELNCTDQDGNQRCDITGTFTARGVEADLVELYSQLYIRSWSSSQQSYYYPPLRIEDTASNTRQVRHEQSGVWNGVNRDGGPSYVCGRSVASKQGKTLELSIDDRAPGATGLNAEYCSW